MLITDTKNAGSGEAGVIFVRADSLCRCLGVAELLRYEVHMHMWNIPSYDGEQDVIRPRFLLQLAGELPGDLEQVIGDIVRQFPEPSIMLRGNDERMARPHRLMIGERDYLVVLMMRLLAWDLACDYLAENTAFHIRTVYNSFHDVPAPRSADRCLARRALRL